MRLAGLALVLCAARAGAAPVRTAQSDPHPGIHRETWVDSAIPARIELVRVDLTSSEIAVYATKQSDRGLTTSDFAARQGAQVAINGDAFAVAGNVANQPQTRFLPVLGGLTNQRGEKPVRRLGRVIEQKCALANGP